MNEDILQEAINCLLAEGMDKEASAVSDLVAEIERLRSTYYEKKFLEVIAAKDAEIKRLQAQGQAKDFGLSGLADEVSRLKEELAKWQKIAIDLKASTIQDANSGDFVDSRGNHMFQVMDLGKCREQATKELGLQVKQEAGYRERLEKEFLASEEAFYQSVGMVKEAKHKAQVALEKIRRG